LVVDGFLAVLFFFFLYLLALPGLPAGAQPTDAAPASKQELQQEARAVARDVRSIIDTKDFREWEEREWWEWKQKGVKPQPGAIPNPLGEWLADVVKGILSFSARLLPWLLGCGVVIVLVLFIIRYRANWQINVRTPRTKTLYSVQPDGRKTEKFVLPVQIRAAAEAAWRLGDYRAAVGTLYRGALAFIIFVRKIFLSASATENECLRHVRAELTSRQANSDAAPAADSALLADFSLLVSCWQQTAYAHIPPAAAAFNALCERWHLYLQAVDELAASGEEITTAADTPGQPATTVLPDGETAE
jgi:hypothetical protein